MIFIANSAEGQKEGGQELLGGLNCTVHRNFFGSQINSFETSCLNSTIGLVSLKNDEPLHTVQTRMCGFSPFKLRLNRIRKRVDCLTLY